MSVSAKTHVLELAKIPSHANVNYVSILGMSVSALVANDRLMSSFTAE